METYLIPTDLPNGCKNHILQKSINDSSITSVCTHINGSDTDIQCYFDTALSTGDKATLDTLVSNHKGDLINEELVTVDNNNKIKSVAGKHCITPTSPVEIKTIDNDKNLNFLILCNLGSANCTLKHGTGNILCNGSDLVITPMSVCSLVYAEVLSKWLILGYVN